MLGLMRIDRDVPFVRQRLEHTDVIEMCMCHDDAGRAAVAAEPSLGGGADRRCGSGDAGVDQRPIAVTSAFAADEDHVDDRKLPVRHVGDDLSCVVVALEVEFGMLGLGCRRKRNLRHAGSVHPV